MQWSRFLRVAVTGLLIPSIGYAILISFGKLSSDDGGLTNVLHDDLNELD